MQLTCHGVQELSDNGGGNLGLIGSTQVGNKGIDIALLAAGGAISATQAVLAGKVDNAYALIRPPGHHARPNEAMGFCIFANAAIAGLYALDIGGLDRIAFVDWDVHHGTGTQEIFWEDPRALTISLHQENCFPPASGSTNEIGAARGIGTNLNIPLPPGCGEAAYLAAFDQVVLPALTAPRQNRMSASEATVAVRGTAAAFVAAGFTSHCPGTPSPDPKEQARTICLRLQ